MRRETLCVHGSEDATHQTGAVTVPIYQCATFAHPGVGQSTGFDYSRTQNPTRLQAEQTVAALEGGAEGLAFSTGMAAISCMLELFAAGDHIVATSDLYGGTVRLLAHAAKTRGILVTAADTGDTAALAQCLQPNTKAVFVETPTNPMMRLTDVARVRQCIGPDVLLIVDNTFLTPVLCRPLELGADIVVHSGTKYLGGHNDVLAGFLVVDRADLAERLRWLHKTIGAVLAPFDSYLLVRGVKTLALRIEKAQANARAVAAWLRAQPQVTQVFYPGVGAMLSFEVDTPLRARDLLEKLRLVYYAESLGGVESLMTYPVLQTHADVPPEVRNRLGITDRLLRFSVGIEAVEDLIADIGQALAD
ncbi:MAG: PLP-dependent transferase [Oscillospiraceae bacterium]|jgi:cystathionine gamma-synthase|nr:PLP-dependent transferase [Oscillospiraceae bacterium]